MSISLISSPDQLEPVYQNSMPFVVSSTMATQSGFKYHFDVYTINPSTLVETYRTSVNPFPRPNTEGLYSPHYVLQNNVSYKLQPFIQTPTNNLESITYYKVKVGEELNPGLTSTGLVNFFFYLFINCATASIQVNDILTWDKTDKTINPDLDGTMSVVAITSNGVLTDRPFFSLPSSETGTFINQLRYGYTSPILYAFNGCRQYDEVSDNFYNDYVLTYSSAKWITEWDMGQEKGLYFSDYQTLSYIAATSGTIPDYALFNFYDKYDENLIVATYAIGVTSSLGTRIDIPTGPANIDPFGLDAQLHVEMTRAYLNQVNYSSLYRVRMVNWPTYPSGSPTSLCGKFQYRFNKSIFINSNRPNSNEEYPLITIAFLNKLGAFEYLTFNLVSKTSTKINRKNYKKVLNYNYTIGDRGNTINDMNIVEELSLTSDWLSDEEALQVRTLLESQEVYIIDQLQVGVGGGMVGTSEEDSSYGVIQNITSRNSNIYPVIVRMDSYTEKNTLNDIIFNFSLTVEKAYNIYTNI